MPVPLDIVAQHEPRSGTVQYIAADPATGRCALIDPVLDFDLASGSVGTASADALAAEAARRGWMVEWILDTHPHADHLSAAAYLHGRLGAPTGIGAGIGGVQRLWSELYDLPPEGPDHWSRLFAEGDEFRIGSVPVRVMDSPGHTLCSVSYVADGAAFIHDTLFMPDSGTARADFPGGDAAALWESIQRILALPPETRLFTGHDYRPGGRPAAWESLIAEQRAGNAHLARGREGFIALRRERDRTLPLPRMMLAALQVNVRGGRLPEPEADGRRYLKLPLVRFPDAPWG